MQKVRTKIISCPTEANKGKPRKTTNKKTNEKYTIKHEDLTWFN